MTETTQPMFRARTRCISCRSETLEVLDSGRFVDEPLRSFIEGDPWGESPLPSLGEQRWEYVRCTSCGQAFQKWLLSPDWQEIKFSRWMTEEAMKEFERRFGKALLRNKYESAMDRVKHVLRIEKMTRAIRGDGPVRLMDFGCGWGEFPALAAQFGFEACGVDRSVSRQENSRGRGIPVFPDLETVARSFGGGLHAVTLFQVLEHLDEPLDLLVALHGMMVPGAVLVVEVPNCLGVVGIKSRSDYYNIHPLEHFNCFTADSLRKIAERAGFASVAPTTAHVTADPARVVKGVAKGLLHPLRTPNTNQYFRRS